MRSRGTAARLGLPRLKLLVVIAAVGFAACGPGATQDCPFQTPVCPDPQPSYAGEVAAIIQTYCVGCHGPGGQESIMPFATWQDINGHSYAGPMQRQLLACLMPPSNAPAALPADKKATLVGWLTCGAPNN
jgi:hypothetical protein